MICFGALLILSYYEFIVWEDAVAAAHISTSFFIISV
jgi:hypothetical protein